MSKKTVSRKTKKIAFRIAIAVAIVGSIIGSLFLIANFTAVKIPYFSASNTGDDTVGTVDCSEVMCNKDLCPDGQNRRQIGEDCCACPVPDISPKQDPEPITTNCQNAICPKDLCPDGRSRRKIGDNCCACGTPITTPTTPITTPTTPITAPITTPTTPINTGPQTRRCVTKKCTNAWEDKPGKQQLEYIEGTSWLTACCQRKKCSNYNCTGDYEHKPNADTIYGVTQSDCCKRKASAEFTPQCQDFCKNPGISLNTKCGYVSKVCSACTECQNWSAPTQYEPIYIGGRPLNNNRVSKITLTDVPFQ